MQIHTVHNFKPKSHLNLKASEEWKKSHENPLNESLSLFLFLQSVGDDEKNKKNKKIRDKKDGKWRRRNRKVLKTQVSIHIVVFKLHSSMENSEQMLFRLKCEYGYKDTKTLYS